VASLKGRKDAVAMVAKRGIFLSAIGQGHSVGKALEMASLARSTMHAWKAEDQVFVDEYRNAFDSGSDVIEEALLKDAMKSGNWVAKLAILKARRPNIWRENVKVEHQHTQEIIPGAKMEEFIQRLERKRSEIMEARRKGITLPDAGTPTHAIDLVALPSPEAGIASDHLVGLETAI
jgi:hypothetical protein